MANINVLDAAAASKYLKTSGAGTNVDPFIPEHLDTNSAAALTALQSVDTKTPALGQALAAASVPIVLTAAQLTTLTPTTGLATSAKQDAEATLIGAVNETAPASDTASSGTNGRLQRIAQNLTTLFGRFVAAATLADSTALPSTTSVGASNYLYNGATLDLQRGNVEGTALASAARTAATASSDMTNHNCRGVIVFLNVSAASGTGGLTIQIQGKDPVGLGYFTNNAVATAVTATGRTSYLLYPTAGANFTQSNNGVLSRTWRINVAVGDSSSYTYTVAYCLMV